MVRNHVLHEGHIIRRIASVGNFYGLIRRQHAALFTGKPGLNNWDIGLSVKAGGQQQSDG